MIHWEIASRWLILVIAVGLIAGLAIGLWAGWIAWPVQITNVDVSDLRTSSQDDYVVLTASTYAFDHNLSRAKERLAQLNDPKINDRVAALAKQYAAQSKPAAAQLAALAVALGSSDTEIALIATTATPTITLTPIPTDTSTPTLAPTATPTITPTATITPTRTPTRRPVKTATPKPAPVAATNWIPGFPAGWPSGVKYQDVSGSTVPGQKYWHLAKAIYCDSNDEHDYCQNMPGGPLGTNTYVTLAGGFAPLSVVGNDGTVLNLEPKSAADMCNCTYTFESNGFTIQVVGAPSDKVSGMALYSVKAGLGNFHVRYFLTFQLVTR
ncbi:MAG: hypothetical protein KGJ80_08415 [Chloroflexota bacterium]|nr:hypothetical protein [Chloroflexota bacterium]